MGALTEVEKKLEEPPDRAFLVTPIKRRDRFFDALFRRTTMALAVFSLVLVAAIALSLLWEGRLAFKKFGLPFLWTSVWNPVTDQYGAWVAIYGTVVASLIAIVIAVPVSFGISLFITELAPLWLKRPVSDAIELLAAIPSVIFGMWGLFVLAPLMALDIEPWISAHLGALPLLGFLFSGPPMGIGMLTAGIILAIMIIPIISSVMREVFSLTPVLLKESAFGLGATTWEVAKSVVLPYTRAAVSGAIFLGLGRALGETMAVTFVIGNAHDWSSSLLQPGTTISAVLANEFTEATTPMYKSSLLALGFILFILTFLVLVLAHYLLWRVEKQSGANS